MNMTIGNRIAALRKQKGMKQDELAEKLGVSPQAVSKWENDISCPDISILPRLAQLLEVSVDELLTGQKPQSSVKIVPAEERKDIKDMMLRIVVDSADGDKVRINLPMQLVQVAVDIGAEVPQLGGNGTMKNIDLAQILQLVQQGVTGDLLQIESGDGDIVHVFVE